MFSQVVPWQRVKSFISIHKNYSPLFPKRLQAGVSILLVLFFFEMLPHQVVAVAVVRKSEKIVFK